MRVPVEGDERGILAGREQVRGDPQHPLVGVLHHLLALLALHRVDLGGRGGGGE